MIDYTILGIKYRLDIQAGRGSGSEKQKKIEIHHILDR